jgi:hypothetical protein
MTMTLLETLQEFTDRNGLDRPSIVMSSTDDTIRQLRALANEVITDITGRGNSWARLQKQATFQSVAAELQGTLATIAPYGFKYLMLDTIYDRTERRVVFGPKNAPAWQEAEALPTTGPLYAYRIWQGNFYMQPAPPADHEMAFEYASDFAILKADGTTWLKRFADDTDSFALNEDLMLYGLQWKWRRRQGLSYAQEKQDYEALLAQEIGTEPTKGEINMAGGSGQGVRPGIWVPSGNWPVSN